jgi:hypothetical protein
MFNDFITINEHHTFRKSEVQGFESEDISTYYWVSDENRNIAIREYHNKWIEELEVGHIEEERKMI